MPSVVLETRAPAFSLSSDSRARSSVLGGSGFSVFEVNDDVVRVVDDFMVDADDLF